MSCGFFRPGTTNPWANCVPESWIVCQKMKCTCHKLLKLRCTECASCHVCPTEVELHTRSGGACNVQAVMHAHTWQKVNCVPEVELHTMHKLSCTPHTWQKLNCPPKVEVRAMCELSCACHKWQKLNNYDNIKNIKLNWRHNKCQGEQLCVCACIIGEGKFYLI